MKILKNILNWIVLLFTGKGDIADDAINAGVVSYEGQGRNEYGK